MRISDWSSDVCSSDLMIGDPAFFLDDLVGDEQLFGAQRARLPQQHDLPPDRLFDDVALRRLLGSRVAQPHQLGDEIGRASCRERVCQYVSISVVAVSLKKTNTANNNNKVQQNK